MITSPALNVDGSTISSNVMISCPAFMSSWNDTMLGDVVSGVTLLAPMVTPLSDRPTTSLMPPALAVINVFAIALAKPAVTFR